MSDDPASPLETFGPGLVGPLLACARGELPPNVAVLKVLIEASHPDEAEAVLVAAQRSASGEEARGRLSKALDLLKAHPQAFATVKAVLRGVEHGGTAPDPDAGVARWAADFERMAAASPEGSVALYALGDPGLFKAATDEIVAHLRAFALLGAERTVLDLGCGIGRLTAALAPFVRHVTGIDIAPAMIARARERCAGLPNVALQIASGRDLAGFGAESFDLVLAADVFPYLVQAGPELVATHVREAARVLKPGGALAILNYSYRGDPARDRADVDALACESGLILARHALRDFACWDGATFHLVKSGRR